MPQEKKIIPLRISTKPVLLKKSPMVVVPNDASFRKMPALLKMGIQDGPLKVWLF